MFLSILRGHRQTPYREINSPLPRLIEYRCPLVGEWIYDKHERPLTAFILLCVEIGDFP